jgi:DNA-directed RNA polymerase specialized sigma24 family protein
MTGEELHAFARKIGGRFAVAFWFDGDPEDVQQDAAEAVWVAYQRSGLPLKGNVGYYNEPATCEARLAWNLGRAKVSLTEHALRQPGASRAFDKSCTIVGCGVNDEDADDFYAPQRANPPDERARPDRERHTRDLEAVRRKLWSIFEDHLAQLPAADRQAVSMLLGIGGPQLDPEEVLEKTGRTGASIWAAVRRFGRSVRDDRGAVRARRALRASSEELGAA